MTAYVETSIGPQMKGLTMAEDMYLVRVSVIGAGSDWITYLTRAEYEAFRRALEESSKVNGAGTCIVRHRSMEQDKGLRRTVVLGHIHGISASPDID